MKKISVFVVIFIAGLACGLILTHGPLHAQGSVNENDVMAKLDEISKSQEDITATIGSIKEDIQIIKLRVTQMQ